MPETPAATGSILDALLGRELPEGSATRWGPGVYRILLGAGAVFLLAFGFAHALTQPQIAEPLWVRGVIAALALGTALGSYYSSWMRRHLGRLFRTCTYLLVPWFSSLLVLNQFAWSYALGLVFLYAATGLAFGIGLRRIEPLLGFLTFGAIVPLSASFWVSAPAASSMLLAVILTALGVMTALVTDWRITLENELEAQQERYEHLYREQKHREEKLIERDLLLEHIRRRAEEVIWVTTPEKNEMEFISEAYAEVWGRSTKELKERPRSFVEAIHPEDRERVKAALEDQQQDPESYDEIYRVVTPDEEIRWVRDRAAGVYDEDGELIRVVGIATDITAERRRDEQLRLLDRIIQHDLRHDVSHAQGWGDMLSRGADPDRASEQIQAATGRIIELLNSADALQRALRSGHELELEPVLLHPDLEQAVRTVRRRLPDAEIQLDAGAAESVYVRANRLLGSLFENLIANGVRHNDQDSPVVEVEVERVADRVQVIVADDGPGIPPDQREQIFAERSRGLDSEGMGLGLYLVRTLADHYGAQIEITENQPRGTRFIVELEIVREREEVDA